MVKHHLKIAEATWARMSDGSNQCQDTIYIMYCGVRMGPIKFKKMIDLEDGEGLAFRVECPQCLERFNNG